MSRNVKEKLRFLLRSPCWNDKSFHRAHIYVIQGESHVSREGAQAALPRSERAPAESPGARAVSAGRQQTCNVMV